MGTSLCKQEALVIEFRNCGVQMYAVYRSILHERPHGNGVEILDVRTHRFRSRSFHIYRFVSCFTAFLVLPFSLSISLE
jgi:hypothetical protein